MIKEVLALLLLGLVRALALLLVRALAPLRRARRLLGTDGEKYMHKPSKNHE